MVENPSDWVRIGVVAKTLGLSESRVRQLADEGSLPVRRTPGGHRLFNLPAVRELETIRRLRSRPDNEPAAKPSWERAIALDGADEAEVWRAVRGDLDLPDTPATLIAEYAFTEMLNNAIDHSGGETAVVRWWRSRGEWAFDITDDGDGAFPHVRDGLGLADLFAAVEELSKGRTTTAPDRHTGVGIFFTSHAVDVFRLASAGLVWTVDNLRGDQAVGISRVTRGTRVACEIDPATKRRLTDVFERFTDDYEFSRSRTVVRLFGLGVRFVSRSEAKRLLTGLERFHDVEVDFTGVDEVGQGFVDELVRVWPREHPQTRIRPTGMNPAVEFMVRRGLSRARPPTA